MDVLLITIGSAGDVHPFIGLGLALRARGHQVTLATNDAFEPLIRDAGLNFLPLGTAREFEHVLNDPDLWHPTRGMRTVFEKGVLPLVRPAYDLIANWPRRDRLIVVAHGIAFGARIAQDALGVPTVTVHLAPAVFRGLRDSPRLPGLPMPNWTPRPIKRGVFWIGDRLVLDPLLAPPINALREELRLKPARSILGSWWHSPQRVIAMFPPWFAAPQPDWPAPARLTGFPLYDARGVLPMPPELEEFLAAGDAPIVITAGSAMRHAARVFHAAIGACVALGRRAVLLTRFAQQLPPDPPPFIRQFDYAPFSALLPRSALFIHHGGIGTTAQALAAGVAQLITPYAHDQFDNALRVTRLGAGSWLDPRRCTMRRMRAAIESASAPAIGRAAAAIPVKFSTASGLEEAASLVEAEMPRC